MWKRVEPEDTVADEATDDNAGNVLERKCIVPAMCSIFDGADVPLDARHVFVLGADVETHVREQWFQGLELRICMYLSDAEPSVTIYVNHVFNPMCNCSSLAILDWLDGAKMYLPGDCNEEGQLIDVQEICLHPPDG